MLEAKMLEAKIFEAKLFQPKQGRILQGLIKARFCRVLPHHLQTLPSQLTPIATAFTIIYQFFNGSPASKSPAIFKLITPSPPTKDKSADLCDAHFTNFLEKPCSKLQREKQQTMVQSITAQQSSTLVKNIIRTSLSAVAYLRNLFPEDHFERITGKRKGTHTSQVISSKSIGFCCLTIFFNFVVITVVHEQSADSRSRSWSRKRII